MPTKSREADLTKSSQTSHPLTKMPSCNENNTQSDNIPHQSSETSSTRSRNVRGYSFGCTLYDSTDCPDIEGNGERNGIWGTDGADSEQDKEGVQNQEDQDCENNGSYHEAAREVYTQQEVEVDTQDANEVIGLEENKQDGNERQGQDRGENQGRGEDMECQKDGEYVSDHGDSDKDGDTTRNTDEQVSHSQSATVSEEDDQVQLSMKTSRASTDQTPLIKQEPNINHARTIDKSAIPHTEPEQGPRKWTSLKGTNPGPPHVKAASSPAVYVGETKGVRTQQHPSHDTSNSGSRSDPIELAWRKSVWNSLKIRDADLRRGLQNKLHHCRGTTYWNTLSTEDRIQYNKCVIADHLRNWAARQDEETPGRVYALDYADRLEDAGALAWKKEIGGILVKDEPNRGAKLKSMDTVALKRNNLLKKDSDMFLEKGHSKSSTPCFEFKTQDTPMKGQGPGRSKSVKPSINPRTFSFVKRRLETEGREVPSKKILFGAEARDVVWSRLSDGVKASIDMNEYDFR